MPQERRKRFQFPNVWPKLHRWQSMLSNRTGITVVAIASLGVTGLLLGLRELGKLQALELAIYDQMVRLRSDSPPDPRLLIVEITEQDIQVFNRFPLSDRSIARVLEKLQSFDPKLIGLDLYRDIPYEPGRAELLAQLQVENVVAINKLPDRDTKGVPPPPHHPPNQVGFNDLVLDSDGIVRRALLYGSTEEGTAFSLALRLATAYLKDQQIKLRVAPDGQLELGQAHFPRLQPTSAGYHHVDANGYQTLLNYGSRGAIARRLSLTQVLYGRIQADWVKDKIVLIGTTAPSGNDLFQTPYSAERDNPQKAGILVHAQILSQILNAATGDRPPIHWWSDRAEIAWLIAWAIIGGILAWMVRHPLRLIVTGTLCLVELATIGFSLFLGTFPSITSPIWIPIATPMLGFILTSATVLTVRAYTSARQQQIIMKLLGQNTSPEVAKALWNSREYLLKSGTLPGQKLIATMLFSDIKDFSTISEQMPPEALLTWLNELLGHMTEVVTRHQGIVNKFTGDGIMAVFGVPVPRTNAEEIAHDAQSAVNCALDIAEILEKLNHDWNQRNLPVVNIRIGIFTGAVVVGSLGGKSRLEYGVIGDSVNIASRLESCTKERQPSACRILIAQETLDYLQNQFEIESWGPMALKGKQQMVSVYRVVGRCPSSPQIPKSTQKLEHSSNPLRLK